ncbi:MAG: L-glyceraldehyde 3-phosphate reductase, partial [Elusimicrobia bacterium RIFOXYA2_FULL_40_6]
KYNRCGKSGLMLPAISLGLWHNFSGFDDLKNSKQLLFRAFDLGITHFDLANNYGPPAGHAESFFGKVMKSDLKKYRDELIISTKAGHYMWPGPYGDHGSKKYLIASLNQSLKRMNLDYVDIFYSHRPDPDTPLEETMGALAQLVKQGKALYTGISNYKPEQVKASAKIVREKGEKILIHQPKYSMFDRWIEEGLLDTLEQEGIGCIAFCPLAQGLLTNKYLNGIPSDSRVTKKGAFLKKENITKEVIDKVSQLNKIAGKRGQKLAQMALAWVLKDKRVTSALIGASKISQLEENVRALDHPDFSQEELNQIDSILKPQI